MRSGTSCFDWTVFKKTVCRFWPLWGAYLAIWLVVLPLNGLMMLRLEAQARPGITGGYMENFAFQVPQMVSGDWCLLMLVFGGLCAMAAFSHLYNARSANFFGSLPIRREGLFVTHYLAGLAFFIVPNALIFLLTLAVEAAGGCVNMEGLLFWLAVSCGECFFFYSLAVFCAMFTGHILALPAFFGIVNALAYGVTWLVLTVLKMFYYGFDTFSDGAFNVVKWLTPPVRLAESVQAFMYHTNAEVTGVALPVLETHGLGTVGIYAAAAVVLAVCAFLLYRVRNLESAGDVVSVKCMRPVFQYGVAFCAGLALGIGTTFFIGGGKITLIAAIVVWGVIGCFAAQMLLDKSFKVFRKWKGAAVVAGAFLVLSLVVNLDLTGFETRVPAPGNVASVYVDGLDAVHMGDGGDLVRLEVDNPAQIELITTLHRAAVEQRDWEQPPEEYGVTTGLKLIYSMKNGSTLTRRYRVWIDPGQTKEEGAAAWALEQLYADRELYWQAYQFDALEERLAEPGWRLERAEVEQFDYSDKYGYETDRQGTFYLYAPYARTLLDAVEEDFRAGRIGARTLSDLEWYPPVKGRTIFFWAQDSDYNNFWTEITVQDNSASTLKALEALEEFAVWAADPDEPGMAPVP